MCPYLTICWISAHSFVAGTAGQLGLHFQNCVFNVAASIFLLSLLHLVFSSILNLLLNILRSSTENVKLFNFRQHFYYFLICIKNRKDLVPIWIRVGRSFTVRVAGTCCRLFYYPHFSSSRLPKIVTGELSLSPPTLCVQFQVLVRINL